MKLVCVPDHDKLNANDQSIFLLGPTPRKKTGGASWRPEMIKELLLAGFDGTIFMPEDKSGEWQHEYESQIAWEQRYLKGCKLILAWIPRDLEKMPGFTTNVEFGMFVSDESRHMLYGRPNDSPKTKYLDALYKIYRNKDPSDNMKEVAEDCVKFFKDYCGNS